MFIQQSSVSDSALYFVFGSSKAGWYREAVKRPLELFLVFLVSPVVIPLIFLLAVLVMLDGGKPFYSQLRVGRGGCSYRLWKMRSMVVDADDFLATYLDANPEARTEWNLKQKLRNDPRVTRLGHLLRASSMDELPQLWNVVTGKMSLIGPRPMLPEQQSMYSGDAYFSLRPGITGLWQVSGRNHTSFSDRADYDERYDRHLSLGLDLQILMRTVAVVLRRTGY